MGGSVLIVDDDEVQRNILSALLQRQFDFRALEAEHGHIALDILASEAGQNVRLVILDLNMPVMGGMETLDLIRQKYPALSVIMLTGSKDTDDAVKAIKLGAVDFITKPYERERMATTVRNALKLATLSKEVSRLKKEQSGYFTFDDLVGAEGSLLPLVTIGRKAAASDIPVLITGETGTGKEVFARAIHGEGKRKDKPFIAVNCGAIPTQLVESTLFGHEKGSFTGATDKKIGKFREANGGTIFLDEVGELPLDTQVKLLRVLQQKEVEPVGASKAVPADIRVISATNRNLEQEVAAGRFREDLFFRLNVLHIDMLPLRQRLEDISTLAHHFVERFCVKEDALPKELSEQTLNALRSYDWPGNIRQLENIMNRAMVLSDEPILDIHDMGALLSAQNSGKENPINSENTTEISLLKDNGVFKTIYEVEQEAIQHALEYSQGNVTQAAKALGMAKSTFYKKIKS